MPAPISGIDARIQQARNRHQELHAHAAQPIAQQRQELRRLTTTVNALNEAHKALDTKANTALYLSALACTISIAATLSRRQ